MTTPEEVEDAAASVDEPVVVQRYMTSPLLIQV